MRKVLAFGLLLAVGSVAHAAEPVNVVKVVRTGNRMPGPGPRPVRKDNVEIQVRVVSGGCTEAKDFDVNVVESATGEAKITINRLKVDSCEAFIPEGEIITLNAQVTEKVKTVKVTNPSLVIEQYAY